MKLKTKRDQRMWRIALAMLQDQFPYLGEDLRQLGIKQNTMLSESKRRAMDINTLLARQAVIAEEFIQLREHVKAALIAFDNKNADPPLDSTKPEGVRVYGSSPDGPFHAYTRDGTKFVATDRDTLRRSVALYNRMEPARHRSAHPVEVQPVNETPVEPGRDGIEAAAAESLTKVDAHVDALAEMFSRHQRESHATGFSSCGRWGCSQFDHGERAEYSNSLAVTAEPDDESA
jgi:hypothetical protein